MNITELKSRVNELGFPFGYHFAMSGSEYISVDGIRFRISDHIQPSHYQIRNYTDVSSYEDILNIISNPNFNEDQIEIVEENGKKYEVKYDEKTDSFIYI